MAAIQFQQVSVLSRIAAILLAPGCAGSSEEDVALRTNEDVTSKTRIEGLAPSPDGKQLAYAVIQESPCIAVFSVDDTSTRRFPAPGRLETFYGVSWGPNGDFLVATVIGDSQNESLYAPFRIWKVNLADGQWAKVVELEDDICQRGVVSPDGERLVFRVAVKKDLHIFDLHTGTIEKLTESGDTDRLGYAWAPDGASLYYSRDEENGEPGIWQIDVNVRKPRFVVNGVYCPALAASRSGRYLAYVSEAPDGSRRLLVANSDGSDPNEICVESDIFFSWSAGQDRIASTSNGRLETWDASTRASVPVELAGNARKSYPVWLEEGRMVAAVCNEKELWVYDFNTKTQQKVFAIEGE